jgi:hypothetical protein
MKMPFNVIIEVRDSLRDLRNLASKEGINSIGSKNDFSTAAFAVTDKSLVPLSMLNMYIDRMLAEMKVEVEHE